MADRINRFVNSRIQQKRGFTQRHKGRQQANLSEKIVAGHETFWGFLRLYR